MFPVELARFIEHAGITVWYSVPSVLTSRDTEGRRCERCTPAVRPARTDRGARHTVAALDEAAQEIPIGRPISGVDAYPVTDDGERASPGNVGELHVTGPTVMQGY
jgi:acyl-CoA synthetase (AMP-forming)/AMP-acid ligase II